MALGDSLWSSGYATVLTADRPPSRACAMQWNARLPDYTGSRGSPVVISRYRYSVSSRRRKPAASGIA